MNDELVVQSAPAKLAEPEYVDRSLKLYVVAAGDSYHRLVLAIQAFRMLFRRLNGLVMAAQAATSTFVPRKVNRKPSKHAAARAHAAEEARDFLGVNVDCEKLRQLVIQWMGGSDAVSRRFYELRRVYFGTLMRELEMATNGELSFAVHMFDTIRDALYSTRWKPLTMARGGKLPWAFAEALGLVDMLAVKQMPMSIMRTCGREYAELFEDNDGIRMLLRWGNDAVNSATVIIEGSTVDATGKERTRSLKNNCGARKLLHQMATGELEYTTPTINVDKDGRLTLGIRYKKAINADAARELDPKRTAELDFFAVLGRELPAKKDDVGTDDDKLVVLHCRHGQQKFRIAVNNVLGDLERIKGESAKVGLERSCCQRWPRRIRRLMAERQRRITVKRTRRAKDANHVWSRQVAAMVASWRCKYLTVYGPPDGAKYGLTGVADSKGAAVHPWDWATFKTRLADKAHERGIVIEYKPHGDLQAVFARLNATDEAQEEEADRERVASDL